MQDSPETLFISVFGTPPSGSEPIAGAGSSRRYTRLHHPDGRTVIACEGDDRKENEAFIYLSEALAKSGIRVPDILAVSDSVRCYLQEDFGDTSLYQALMPHIGTGSTDPERLLAEAVTTLPHIQIAAASNIDFSRCHPDAEMDARMVRWDLNYFKYNFLKVAGTTFDERLLEDDFDRLTLRVTDPALLCGFMYRDFQSRNIMVLPDRTLGFIDFQSGRRGPVHYDLASLLWQIRLKLPEEDRIRLTDLYLSELHTLVPSVNPDLFRQQLVDFVLIRTLQVMGAYGFRGLIQHKSLFLEPLADATAQLSELMETGALDHYPELKRVCSCIIKENKFFCSAASGLTVSVSSFSFRKGYPDDFSGNGGGFVFDCRGMHNPGRYEEYKPLTGRDRPVREFLAERGEVQPFLQAVRQLMAPTVECYLRRGFTHLSVAFGCTGGRHRSVYCAEQIARWLSENYDLTVELTHREQGISETLRSE